MTVTYWWIFPPFCCNFGGSVYLFIFNWIIALQQCIGFCHTPAWISRKYTLCRLPLESPSDLRPHPTPLGYHRAPDSSSLCHTTHSHWLSLLHMVMLCFSATLSIHPTLSFPHRVHKSALYVCGSIARRANFISVPLLSLALVLGMMVIHWWGCFESDPKRWPGI